MIKLILFSKIVSTLEGFCMYAKKDDVFAVPFADRCLIVSDGRLALQGLRAHVVGGDLAVVIDRGRRFTVRLTVDVR